MKLLTRPEQALVKKDFGEIWNTKLVRATLLAVPICLVVLLPIVFLAMVFLVPMDQLNGADQMQKLIPEHMGYFTLQQSMFYMMTNIVSPMFFLMVPLMTSTVSSANSFVGEKERNTIETLLLCPLKVRQIFKAKVIGCFLLSAISTLISFIAFSIVVGVGDAMLNMPFFFNWNWLALIFVLTPAVTVFGVIFMVLISGKAKSYVEAVQLSGYVVLPLILLFVGQFTGLFQLNAWILLSIGIVLIVLDIILWGVAARSFKPEALLK